jgi:hypothetical protein
MSVKHITKEEFNNHCFNGPKFKNNSAFLKIRTCISKFAFISKEYAEIARKKMKDYNRLHSYKCTYCDYWHLGHVRDAMKE